MLLWCPEYNVWAIASFSSHSSTGVFTPSGPPSPTNLETLKGGIGGGSSLKTAPIGDPEARKSSVEAFFHRNGDSSYLSQDDLRRIGDEVGTKPLPGNANAKLIGGKWR